MEDLIKRLSTQKSTPRLWIERLTIFSEPSVDHTIRSIEFRRGINVIWAHEPAVGSVHKGIHAAGHGVGKTSLCLLIRYCLGDSAKSVSELREDLFDEFPQGGVGAVLHVANKTFVVFRFFSPHKEGIASTGDGLDSLLRDDGNRTFKEFEADLANVMLSTVFPRAIPETGQPIEWRHVLAWITRDQGSRFKSYFAWREGEGAGLQRSRQDPPIVMRAVLGLLDQGESDLLVQLRTLGRSLEAEHQETERLRQEPILVRRRIESELRAWLNVRDDLPLRSNDLFKESVENAIAAVRAKAAASLAEADARYEVASEQLVDLRAELLLHTRNYEQADQYFQLADAGRRRDESTHLQFANRRAKLMALTDSCEYGGLYFKDCQHIQNEIANFAAANLKDQRDQRGLANSLEDWTTRAVLALARKRELDELSKDAQKRAQEKEQECKALRMKRNTAALEVDRGRNLLSELERWERTSGSGAAAQAIEESIARTAAIAGNMDTARLQLHTTQHERSNRERGLSELTDGLARELLSNEAFGAFVLRDESRPFQLSVRGGEAYRVLEVLLGDLVCMLDGANQGSAFPGLLIHDCPREADMSHGLYDSFLLLIARIEREAFGDSAPFQYIVTTTTPPPSAIQQLPYLRETLGPSTDEGLLFRRRLGASKQRTRLQME